MERETPLNGLNLPTDNLYKFIALAGLALILFGVYFMITRGEQGTALRNQLEIESALIDVEDNQIELAWEKLKPKLGPEARALERARDEIKKRKARFTATAENNTRFLKFNMFLFEQLRIFIYVGIGLAAIGFSLWYWKVQRYMDKELREQSAQVKKERKPS